jgi:hypothetical protein
MMYILFILLNVMISIPLNADKKISPACSLICNLNMIGQSSFIKKCLGCVLMRTIDC